MGNKEFEALSLHGSNYPTWASDIKIAFASRGLLATIQEPQLIWPEANHEWNLLCLQDFKSVADYNHVVHRICSKLKFCEKEPTDTDKIEKTLSAMLSSDRVLQQQYRAHN
jgi:hypothetical protein